MKTQWIDTSEKLDRYVASLRDVTSIAVDTESDHFHAYFGQVCLIQVAAPGDVALIDPLGISDADLAPLMQVFSDPEVEKIMHAGRNDVLEFDRDFGGTITNYFDTQVAARFAGYESLSLDGLLQETLEIEPVKAYSRFDWASRPLPEGPRLYAATDVAYLHELRSILVSELGEWTEPCRQFCEHIAETVRYEEPVFDPESWRKMKSAKGLDPRARAAARELFIVRHEICEDTNIAPVHLFDNWTLARVAKKRPTSIAQLERIRGVSNDVVKFWGDRFVDAIKRSLRATPPGEKPEKRKRGKRMTDAAKLRYADLAEWRDNVSEDIGLSRDLVFTNSVLREIAAERPRDLGALAKIDGVLPWRVERLGDDLLAKM